MQLLSPKNFKDYELIDVGGFEKLERFGSYITIRPEPQAVWDKSLSNAEWEKRAHVKFIPRSSSSGEWKKLKKMLRYNQAESLKAMQTLLADKQKGYSRNHLNLSLTSAYMRNTREKLVALIRKATKSIQIEMLLFNDREVLTEIGLAALRGVKIRVLIDPGNSFRVR